MNIKELIEKLQTYNPETKVVVEGYESGYDDIEEIDFERVKENKDANWYDGKYERARTNFEVEEKVLVLSR